MTGSVVGLRRSPRSLPKAKLAPKEVMVTVWWSAACPIYSFLNLNKTITSEKYAQQPNEMHQKLQCLHLTLVNRKGPILLHDKAKLNVAQPMLLKINKFGYEVLPHPRYSPDLSPTDYHFFKDLNNFLQAKCFCNSRRQEMLSKSFTNWSTDFYATRINKLIFHWQKCVDCNGSYFD